MKKSELRKIIRSVIKEQMGRQTPRPTMGAARQGMGRQTPRPTMGAARGGGNQLTADSLMAQLGNPRTEQELVSAYGQWYNQNGRGWACGRNGQAPKSPAAVQSYVNRGMMNEGKKLNEGWKLVGRIIRWIIGGSICYTAGSYNASN
tara:strand:- start:148 stop:588 length:441 start_codon:yes stop_codon:yes gene_type:complete